MLCSVLRASHEDKQTLKVPGKQSGDCEVVCEVPQNRQGERIELGAYHENLYLHVLVRGFIAVNSPPPFSLVMLGTEPRVSPHAKPVLYH